jgi:hypothetical protein
MELIAMLFDDHPTTFDFLDLYLDVFEESALGIVNLDRASLGLGIPLSMTCGIPC